VGKKKKNVQQKQNCNSNEASSKRTRGISEDGQKRGACREKVFNERFVPLWLRNSPLPLQEGFILSGSSPQGRCDKKEKASNVFTQTGVLQTFVYGGEYARGNKPREAKTGRTPEGVREARKLRDRYYNPLLGPEGKGRRAETGGIPLVQKGIAGVARLIGHQGKGRRRSRTQDEHVHDFYTEHSREGQRR